MFSRSAPSRYTPRVKNTLTLLGITCILLIIATWYAFDHTKTSPLAADTIGVKSNTMAGAMQLMSSEFQSGASIPSQFRVAPTVLPSV